MAQNRTYNSESKEKDGPKLSGCINRLKQLATKSLREFAQLELGHRGGNRRVEKVHRQGRLPVCSCFIFSWGRARGLKKKLFYAVYQVRVALSLVRLFALLFLS